MRHNKRRRENFKAEDSFGHCLLQALSRKGVASLCLQPLTDHRECFDKVRASSAAGVKHIYLWVGETVRDAKFRYKHLIDPAHHIAHDFFRRVPNAKLLPQLWVKGFEERFVEVLHCVTVVEALDELGAGDSV